MQAEVIELKLSEVVFDQVVYPRKDHDPVLVQRYVTHLDEIESRQKFICVATDNKLLDGKHRWLAYRKKYDGQDPTIKAFRYNVTTPHEQLKLAAKLNSEHGWQLTEEDKKADAITLLSYGCTYDDIAETLSVGKAKVTEWLSRTVKEAKERRNKRIFDLWLACRTQEEIAEDVHCPVGTIKPLMSEKNGLVAKVLQNQNNQTDESDNETEAGFKLTKAQLAAADHATDFDVPIYNVWKQQTKTEGSTHFGNSEVRWLDNLLYLYTKPFEIVVDPFAGGGSTVELCKKRLRRYWVGDRKPIVERETEIRKHDLTIDGMPDLKGRWGDVRLVYLDPPYWKQAENEYSKDPSDLANMELNKFNESLAGIIKDFGKKLKNAYIALIIQPTQWKAPERQFTDHIGDMLRAVKLPVEMRYSVPYESQQCTAQMVEWAKENKRCLVLTREIVVWKV